MEICIVNLKLSVTFDTELNAKYSLKPQRQ